MRIHICMIDKDCRRWDNPKRIWLFTKHHELGLALSKNDKFVISHSLEERTRAAVLTPEVGVDELPKIKTAWWFHERKP